MSKEVFLLIQSMDQRKLETQIAIQCAPLLTGIKISNLLIVATEYQNMVFALFKDTPISVFIICRTKSKITFLLFRKEELTIYLNSKEVYDALKTFGYQRTKLNLVLEEISIKYTEYYEHKEDFPHELGLLLGYPVIDVIGFIENEGKNYLFSGYWKVYGDLEIALSLFQKYDIARETVITMFLRRNSMDEIITLHYCNSFSKAAV